MTTIRPDFRKFPKISRLNSPVIITEKIDGTNGVIHVTDDGYAHAGSRNRWLSVDDDNYGFGRWVTEHGDDLAGILGPGWHYGEWFGKGINRGYNLDHRRFYLFAVDRYDEVLPPFGDVELADGTRLSTVPVLLRTAGFNPTEDFALCTKLLTDEGSAINNFPRPEGFCIFWEHNHMILKVVLDKDNEKKPRSVGPKREKKKWTPK